jgi:hypothetical protein
MSDDTDGTEIRAGEDSNQSEFSASSDSELLGPAGAYEFDPHTGQWITDETTPEDLAAAVDGESDTTRETWVVEEYDSDDLGSEVEEDTLELFDVELAESVASLTKPEAALDAPPGGPQPVPAAQVLADAAPIMIISRPHSAFQTVPAILRGLQRATRRSVHMAAACTLRQITPAAADTYLTGCTSADLKIADPVAYTAYDSVTGRKGSSPKMRRWRYQQYSDPSADEDAWIDDVVDAQRTTGANILLSPGRYLPGVDPVAELDTAVRHLEMVQSRASSKEPVLLNLVVATNWLTNPRFIDDLAERAIESSPAGVWLTAMWPTLTTAGQPVETNLIGGYRDLCQTLNEEGIPLLLPTTDLTGWWCMAHGARGFGTGLSAAARAFTPDRSGGGTNGPPKPRVMVSDLLHTILRTEYEQMLTHRIVKPCNCAYCRSASGWNAQAQAGHHIHALASLTSGLSGVTDRASHIADLIDNAIKLAADTRSKIVLERNSIPGHLSGWRQLLP